MVAAVTETPDTSQSTQPTQNTTLAQEPLSAEESQALKEHMEKEMKSELFNSPPKQNATAMQDGTGS